MGAAALAIGTGIQAYTSIKGGMDKKAAYAMEAKAKESQAAQVDIAVNHDVDLLERRYAKTRGAQISAFGRSGVQLSGSPLAQMEETAANAYDEINAIKAAGAYRKSTLLTEGQYSNVMGKQAEDAGYWGAAGSVLSGVSKNPYTYDSKVPAKASAT